MYGEQTRVAVEAFQRAEGLEADGVVGRDTWNALVRRYDRLLATLPESVGEQSEDIYPGRYLSLGQSGADVRNLQRLINRAAEKNSYIPTVTVDGDFGEATLAAVRAVQRNNGLDPSGVVGPVTWEVIRQLGE